MKIRIKFRKYGIMKFIGHLDVMRYFQKAMRRADIDICYSQGFSPHMLMSFASPLGVGLTSDGEYLDIEVGSAASSSDVAARLNAVMTEGVEVVSARRIPEGRAANAMALVAAADYEVSFRESRSLPEGYLLSDKDAAAGSPADAGGAEGTSLDGDAGTAADANFAAVHLSETFRAAWTKFYAQSAIPVTKKTKKGERELDLKPLIYEARCEDDCLFLRLSAGSADNVKPELVLDAFAAFAGFALPPFALLVHRKELYADLAAEGETRRLVSLEELGEEF